MSLQFTCVFPLCFCEGCLKKRYFSIADPEGVAWPRYCSSDSWLGNASTVFGGEAWYFQGTEILVETVSCLIHIQIVWKVKILGQAWFCLTFLGFCSIYLGFSIQLVRLSGPLQRTPDISQVETLLKMGMKHAKLVLFSGCSAGGRGWLKRSFEDIGLLAVGHKQFSMQNKTKCFNYCSDM